MKRRHRAKLGEIRTQRGKRRRQSSADFRPAGIVSEQRSGSATGSPSGTIRLREWPRSRPSSSSSFCLFPPSLSVESLSRPSMSSHLKLWPGYGIRGSLSHSLYFFPVSLLADPASEPQHIGPSDGQLAARLPSQSTMPSSTKRESLCLLCVPTMSELI